MLFQHSKRDSGQCKSTLLYSDSSDPFGNIIILLFFINIVLNPVQINSEHVFTLTVGFDLLELFTGPFLGFRTSFKYVSTLNTSPNQFLTTIHPLQATKSFNSSPFCWPSSCAVGSSISRAGASDMFKRARSSRSNSSLSCVIMVQMSKDLGHSQA